VKILGLDITLDTLEKFFTITAIAIGGSWVYLNAIRGRTFIPRLQIEVSGSILYQGGNQFVLVDMQVKNVGSSIAEITEKGSGLKVSSLRAFGDVPEAIGLMTEGTTAFSVLNFKEGETKKIEPGTAIHAQELIEVPKDKYDAFKLELQVNALSKRWLALNRKWRAISIACDTNSTSQNNI
jgi:hypothetical protein